MHPDERYMARCLQLAELGRRTVAPNPMVGAVIVHDGKIIGEGYHAFYGGPHAEVNAVRTVDDQSLLSEATIYVSLEPCAHFGKTPPCADLLVKHQFKRAVIGTGDPNPQVSGKGIEKLKSAGIEVVSGVLYDEGRSLNRHFYTFHEKKRPYVLLKWAQTPGGLLDNAAQDEGISWISTPETQQYVHALRAAHHGILVGKNTVLKDNPRLNVRRAQGLDPIRIVLDSKLEIPADRHLLSDGNPTIVLNTLLEKTEGAIRYVKPDSMQVPDILFTLHEEGIQSLMVEGGAQTLQAFIDADMWDESCIITGQHDFEKGTQAPRLQGRTLRTEHLFGDTILTLVQA
jgi:diaminohydroxyphosphoribosylaminopyrimidine deaminase/5-amino-6-(5-phosphoribosylamino)uracil reductase